MPRYSTFTIYSKYFRAAFYHSCYFYFGKHSNLLHFSWLLVMTRRHECNQIQNTYSASSLVFTCCQVRKSWTNRSSWCYQNDDLSEKRWTDIWQTKYLKMSTFYSHFRTYCKVWWWPLQMQFNLIDVELFKTVFCCKLAGNVASNLLATSLFIYFLFLAIWE